jgi:hypothetical protein
MFLVVYSIGSGDKIEKTCEVPRPKTERNNKIHDFEPHNLIPIKCLSSPLFSVKNFALNPSSSESQGLKFTVPIFLSDFTLLYTSPYRLPMINKLRKVKFNCEV